MAPGPGGQGRWPWRAFPHRCAADDHHRVGRPGPHSARPSHRGRPPRPQVVSEAPSSPGAGRKLGYRLLGSSFDYLLHLRPAEWPIMAAHTALGYFLAVGLSGAIDGEALKPALAGLALWVVCLNGGTLALNSAFDRDEGDIAYLRRPPPPPRGLAALSLGLMLAGQAAALVLPRAYQVAYAGCVVLSVLYSVPPMRLKAVAGADWIINMVGFGTLTPYAGWAATGLPLEAGRGLALIAFC